MTAVTSQRFTWGQVRREWPTELTRPGGLHVKIRAAVVDHPGEFRIDTVELSEPRSDEVVIRVAAVGICHTDVKLASAGVPPRPAVLGHEGAGVVERVGSAVQAIRVGDRVAASFASCGACPRCLEGRPAYCVDFLAQNMGGRRSDGSSTIHRHQQPVEANFFGQSSFATHAIVAERNLVPLPDDVPFEIAAPMACGFQTGAGIVFNIVPLSVNSAVLIVGSGAVGLAAMLAARALGAAAVVVDPLETRRGLALELGATAAVDPRVADLAAACRDAAGKGFDLALDTSGVAEAQRAAFESLDRTGTLALIANGSTEVSVPTASLLTGKIIRGVIEGSAVPKLFLPRLFELWRRGQFPVERLIKTYDFEQISAAVAASASGDVVKPVLIVDPAR